MTDQDGAGIKNRLRNTIHTISSISPNNLFFNRLIAGFWFVKSHKRLPYHPSSKHAGLNDFIFHRMIRNNWTALEEAAVDKETAKIVAKGLCPDVLIAETQYIFKITAKTTYRDIKELCGKYAGQKVVIKPTHNSGGVILLNAGPPAKEAIDKIYRHLRQNFFFIRRETQYARLKPKLIVEEDISADGQLAVDYKFFCVKGKPLFLQIDTDRFTDHRRELLELPGFRHLDVNHGYEQPKVRTKPPHNLKDMLAIAEKLSAPFDFVRVDLYNGKKGIIFGEFTLSPGAGMDYYSDRKIELDLYRKVKESLQAN